MRIIWSSFQPQMLMGQAHGIIKAQLSGLDYSSSGRVAQTGLDPTAGTRQRARRGCESPEARRQPPAGAVASSKPKPGWALETQSLVHHELEEAIDRGLDDRMTPCSLMTGRSSLTLPPPAFAIARTLPAKHLQRQQSQPDDRSRYCNRDRWRRASLPCRNPLRAFARSQPDR